MAGLDRVHTAEFRENRSYYTVSDTRESDRLEAHARACLCLQSVRAHEYMRANPQKTHHLMVRCTHLHHVLPPHAVATLLESPTSVDAT